MNTDENNTQLPQSSVSVSAFLNGKAKQDFEVFQIHRSLAITNADRLENYKLDFKDLEPYKNHIWRMDKVYLNALLIEWFDSVGIFIIIQKLVYEPLFDCHINGLKNQITSGSFDTRNEATIEAIERANELYNAHFLAVTQAVP